MENKDKKVSALAVGWSIGALRASLVMAVALVFMSAFKLIPSVTAMVCGALTLVYALVAYIVYERQLKRINVKKEEDS